MRTSRVSLAALLPVAVLLTAACGTTVPVPGAAYGTSAAMTPSPESASASASGAGAGPMIPARAMLTVEKTKIGYVLATGTGMTVYWFSRDAKGGTTSACTGTCATSWPAVVGTPVAAAGVTLSGKLGSITRPGGIVQATYNGYPLYTYAGDMSPGQATGNGAGGGAWHEITGALLSPSPAAAAAASARDLGAAGGTAPAPPSSATTGGVSGY